MGGRGKTPRVHYGVSQFEFVYKVTIFFFFFYTFFLVCASPLPSSRSNPELCPLSDDDDGGSDGDITPSQASSLLQDRLQAARRFILSDAELYGRVLQYQPLGLALLQGRLKEAGITLGTAKLMDFLDANCITFTTAKPGQGSSRQRRRGRGGGRGRGGRRKKGVAPTVMDG